MQSFEGDEPSRSPDLPTGCEALRADIERNADGLESWYLAKKRKRSRMSKLLRIFAVLAATCSGLAPIADLLSHGVFPSEWGYVFLIIGGGAMLLDRAFGYSSSWIRFTLAAQRVAALRAEVTVAMARCASGQLDDLSFLEQLAVLSRDLREIEAAETTEWGNEFSRNTSNLVGSFPSPR